MSIEHRQSTNPALPITPLPAFGQLHPKPLKPTRGELVQSLRRQLREIHRMCRSEDDPLASSQTVWPNDKWLEDFSKNLRGLASVHDPGRKTIWDCVEAIENRNQSLKLQKGIDALVDRAAKLRPEPEAITIQRQGMAGSEGAENCFQDLKKCRDRQIRFASVNWEKHRAILKPQKGESCEAKAAQIVIDWLQRKPGIKQPWAALEVWLLTIGNLDLVSKLFPPGFSNPFETIRAKRKEERKKKLAALRQRKYRLSQREHELVRQGRLLRYTRRTPEE